MKLQTKVDFAMVRIVVAAMAFLFATQANANYISSEAHAYKLSCNKDGFVLSSVYPVFRFIEAGAMSRVDEHSPEKLFLGKSCDAYSKSLGNGSWCWANGGFRLEANGHVIGFPRQELYCSNGMFERLPCGC